MQVAVRRRRKTITDLLRKTVLVTGADGFLGRHLVMALVQMGAEVRALDQQFGAEVPHGVEPLLGDIGDPQTMRRAIDGVSIVYHLAAISDLWAPRTEPNLHHRVNVEGTRTALTAAIQAKARRFVYCSSNVVLIAGRRTAQPIDGRHRPARDAVFGAYARSKHDAETLVLAAQSQIDGVIVRPGTPIGPGDHRPTPPGRLVRDLANGAVPALAQKTALNLVDVRVIAKAIARSGYLAPPGASYLLTGCDISFKDFAKMMGDVTGLPMPSERVPYGVALTAAFAEDRIWSRLTGGKPTASFDGLRMAGRPRTFSNAEAKRDLGMTDTDVTASLAEALDWMVVRGMISRSLPGLAAALSRVR